MRITNQSAWMLSLGFIFCSQAFAAATDNLWMCPDPSGVDNVVSATAPPAPECKPYSVSRLKSKQPSAGNPPAAVQADNTTPPNTSITTAPAAAKPSFDPAMIDASSLKYAPMATVPTFWRPKGKGKPDTSGAEPSYRADATKIYLCQIEGEQRVVEGRRKPSEDCLLMGAKGSDAASLAAPPEPKEAHDDATIPSNQPTTAGNAENIYLCKAGDGSESIVQGSEAPSSDCQLMGVTGESSTQTSGTPAKADNQSNAGKTPAQPDEKPGETSIAETESDPGDIYKCYDREGRPSFVNENDIGAYRHCQFFSRSFAGVKKILRAPDSATPLPEDRAVGKRLVCSGAGEVVYNGQSRAYECAERSYDYSKGSTGGEVRSGERFAKIAGHNLDYLETGGSCGGTITSANGRVLHLEPTKDCPVEFKIEARRIAKQVREGLNVKVSGAFRERQRGLSAQINRIASEVGIDVYLVHAVISAESAYKSRAVSHAGARGLMQLMPATARRFNVTDSFHTGQNIRGGATYLKWLLNKFNGNMELAIAGYNAGEGNVIKYGYKIPPFIETKAYVPKVMQYYRRYRNDPSLIGL